MRMRQATVDELEAEWLSGEDVTMVEALLPPYAHPEAVWEAILRIMKHELSITQVALLAAGPVEDLLVLHGPKFIDRVEAEARRNEAFARMLGGVWERDMPWPVWRRVEAARKGRF
jgi:hypothetical protein